MEMNRASRSSGNSLRLIEKAFHVIREHFLAQEGHSYIEERYSLSKLYQIQTQDSNPNQLENNQPIQKTTSSLGSEDDYYSSSSEESEDSDSDDEEFERAISYSVDLVSQEKIVNKAPVYTRSLLEAVKAHVDQLNKEFSLPPIQRTLNEIYAPGSEGKQHKIWDSCGKTLDNSIQVHYFARVELHPDFQRLHGSQTQQIRLMRRYNRSDNSEEDHFTSPYAIATYRRSFNNEHCLSETMNNYWQSLMRTKALWLASHARLRLKELFTSLANTHAPITKLVCFGLGAINLDKAWYAASIQYMAMFTIITALQNEYRKTDPARAGIKLLLQDPNYETRDRMLLGRLWPGNKDDLVFVSDPDGLLAIDAGTIVVSAYLPIQVPLVQIIADLFHDEPASGPAMILGDEMNVDPAKSSYSLEERGAPHAARLFDQQYEKVDSGFEDHGLEDEFGDDVFGEGWMDSNHFYWLNDMELWARKVSRGE